MIYIFQCIFDITPHIRNTISHYRKPYSDLSKQQRWIHHKEKTTHKDESGLSPSFNNDADNSSGLWIEVHIQSVQKDFAVETCIRKFMPFNSINSELPYYFSKSSTTTSDELSIGTMPDSVNCTGMCSSSIQQIYSGSMGNGRIKCVKAIYN